MTTEMKPVLRVLLTLFTILWASTIAGAAGLEAQVGVAFEKTYVLEEETGFSAELDAPKTLTGQIHHPISTKVGRAVDNHPLLSGAFKKRDPRFVTQAADNAAHRGYQRWHRDLDDEVVERLLTNR